jgi:hypothetical protein
MEKVLLGGDLSGLTPEQRLHYYKSVCDQVGVNPLTKPFDYIELDGRLVLYATKDCAAQLRRLHNVDIKIIGREQQEMIYVVEARASAVFSEKKRSDDAIGAVPTVVVRDGKSYPLTPAAYANAVMKAETKAKRRVTLSICGLGILDESEIERIDDPVQTMPDAIVERNVREATVNAVGEEPAVTKDNWKDVVCHIGKAEGELLGKKLGEIKRPLVKWMAENWVPKLPAVPNEKDRRLRDAVLQAVAAGEMSVESAMPVNGNSVQLATLLIAKAQDLVMTPDQLARLLHDQGLLAEGETITDMPVEQLQHLVGDGWKTLKEAHEARVKPQTIRNPKKARKREKANPFE